MGGKERRIKFPVRRGRFRALPEGLSLRNLSAFRDVAQVASLELSAYHFREFWTSRRQSFIRAFISAGAVFVEAGQKGNHVKFVRLAESVVDEARGSGRDSAQYSQSGSHRSR